jgi:hypothetical protein
MMASERIRNVREALLRNTFSACDAVLQEKSGPYRDGCRVVVEMIIATMPQLTRPRV